MSRRSAALAAAAALACGIPEPERLPRIVGAAPQGDGVPTDAIAEVWFDAPVDPAGLTDGRLLVLAPAEVLSEAKAAVESDAGAVGLAGVVGTDGEVDDGGTRVRLRPRAPLRGFAAYALVLSSRVRSADGRPVLDPEGRRRTFVSAFETGAPVGPPPTPALTEVRADAETPEAGGEYVEVLNLGDGPLDLGGWRLAKRTAAGALSSCAIGVTAYGVVLPGGMALVAGGAYDGRYALPPGVPVLSCGASALLGGIANDRAPEILLADPLGEVRATLGAAGSLVCAAAMEKVDPLGPDDPNNLACTGGSPGSLP